MKTDLQIQKDVLAEIQWEPLLQAAQIGVAVTNGIVTLSGQLDSYTKKKAAEKACKKIAGVRGIALDIQVGISPVYKRTDTELADAVLKALEWQSEIPHNKIKVTVEEGSVILEGEVEWDYQRVSACKAVENLAGVQTISNQIRLSPKITSFDIQEKINSAFIRSATLDASHIKAEVTGTLVVLTGNVRSLAEKEDAEIAAWNAPGISRVESKLLVEEPEPTMDV